MNETLIQLPEKSELQEMLAMAKKDIHSEIEKDAEAQSSSVLLVKVIAVVEEKIAKHKNFSSLNANEQIDLGAHLTFLHTLLEDFFLSDDEFEDEDDFTEEDEE